MNVLQFIAFVLELAVGVAVVTLLVAYIVAAVVLIADEWAPWR